MTKIEMDNMTNDQLIRAQQANTDGMKALITERASLGALEWSVSDARFRQFVDVEVRKTQQEWDGYRLAGEVMLRTGQVGGTGPQIVPKDTLPPSTAANQDDPHTK